MTIVDCVTLNQQQRSEVWELLRTYEQDFVPPLSQRRSTCQQHLQEREKAEGEGLYAYFEELEDQRFVLAEEGGKIVGFLSFRFDYIPQILSAQREQGVLGLYITTIIVDASCRRRGVAEAFYHRLMTLYPNRRRLISTRTWSGNSGHISLLQKLDFEGPVCIPDDRGPGIDTVYYYTLLQEEEP